MLGRLEVLKPSLIRVCVVGGTGNPEPLKIGTLTNAASAKLLYSIVHYASRGPYTRIVSRVENMRLC
jgi:hypothetical protein